MARRVWEPTPQQTKVSHRTSRPPSTASTDKPAWEEAWDEWLEKEGSINMNLLPTASRYTPPPQQPQLPLGQQNNLPRPMGQAGMTPQRLPAPPSVYTPPNYTALPPAPPMPPGMPQAPAPPRAGAQHTLPPTPPMPPQPAYGVQPMRGGVPTPPQANPAAPPNLSQTQDRELEMWKKWKQSGRSEDLYPLVKSMDPLVYEEANKWRGRVKFVPDEAIEAEFKGHAVEAIKNYDPSRGAKLSTWVKSNLRRGGRFVKTYQNVGRIVEKRTEVIGDYNQTKAEMGEALGRPPTEREMLAALKQKRPDYRWTNNEVKRMESELRADILSSAFESDMNVFTPSLDAEIAQHMHEELTEDERKVWKYIQNPGKTQGKTGLIAKELGWLDPKVSRMRKSIEAKALDLRRRLR